MVTRTVMSAAALAVMAAGAGAIAARLFIGWQMTLVLVAAAAAAVLLTVLLGWLSRTALIPVLGSVTGLAAVVTGLGLALRGRAATDGSVAAVLVDAWLNAGARLMTASIPIEPAPDTVVLPVAATWIAASAAALLYRRSPLFGLVPPVLLLGAAVVFVGPNAPPAYPAVVAIAVGAAGYLAVNRDDLHGAVPVAGLPSSARHQERLRRWGAGLTMVAATGLLAAVVGPAAAALYRVQPYDPRVLFAPPQRHSDALNPLGLLSAWATDTEIPLLEVRTGRPVRISWVALSRYDGITWLPDDEFRAAGSVLPTVEPSPRQVTPVTQRITVRSLSGAWLPAAEIPREVQGVRVGFDTASRMLAAPDGLVPGMSYTVTSQVPVRDPNLLVGAAVPIGPEYEHLYAVPPKLPEGLAELAERAAGEGTPYQKALRLEKFLRESYRFASDAPSGHGYANLEFFLTESPAEGGGRGTSEQFATAFALLGRLVGLPTRVVVGFHAGVQTAPREYLVRSGDAFAWAEVFLSGEGWVPFDPTPGRDGASPPPEENTPEAAAESASKQEQLQQPDSSPPPADTGDLAAPPSEPDTSGTRTALTLLPLVVVLLAVTAVPVLRHRRRRRRLVRGSPPERVLGAWAEVCDALQLAGRPVPSSAAVRELAAANQGDGLPDLMPLAAQVNAVGFAPAASVSATDADTVVAVARRYVAALRAQQRLVRRWTWWLDPRPLLWRR